MPIDIDLADEEIVTSIIDSEDPDFEGEFDICSKQISVIHTKKREGIGKDTNPFRTVHYYFHLTGICCSEKTRFTIRR